MFEAVRYVAHITEQLLNVLLWCIRRIVRLVEYITRIPRSLRLLSMPILLYFIFALILVYPFAFIRGWSGQAWYSETLKYAGERWLATAIYDTKGNFVGTFDPRMDSKLDVNYSGKPIILEKEDYTATPDHKSIPVKYVPEYYWNCVRYHEDRHISTWLNPFGIDLLGVLKIPYSAVVRSYDARSLRLGAGGSTLSMQLVRANFKLIPSRSEGISGKLGRKFVEWWYAPVIYRALSPDGNLDLFKRWISDHLPLAQRTGGQPLYGVEQTSRVIFRKPAQNLTAAEQFVLAAAVNHPIILLKGSENLNKIRFGAWRRLTLQRAHACAVNLLKEPSDQLAAIGELDRIAAGPPDPKIAPELDATIHKHAPKLAQRAKANPFLRAHLLTPAVRYAARREMENIYGFSWRQYVRSVKLTLNVSENLLFRQKIEKQLSKLQSTFQSRIDPEITLDVAAARKAGTDISIPDILVVAANEKNEIVRYYDAGYNASYFGSWSAIDRKTGGYHPENESRAIASVAKMLAAIAIANKSNDTLATLYVDTRAPARGLETCTRRGNLRRGRRAEVVFACSLSSPIENRLARLGQPASARLIKKLGYNLPPKNSANENTPASTAIARGLITSSPRNVHRTTSLILASLTGRQHIPLAELSLISRLDNNGVEPVIISQSASTSVIVPSSVINPRSSQRLKALLSAPLCYRYKKISHGTLKSLSDWCAIRRSDVRLHFAKTGTQVNMDQDATVDVWLTGGIQFDNGKTYSYVIVVGTGNVFKPYGRKLHAADIAAPLARILLNDLKDLASPRTLAAVNAFDQHSR